MSNNWKFGYRKKELLAYCRNIFKKGNPQQLKVMIFAQGRTGSTLLESLLESTGYFKKRSEILSTKEIEIVSPYHFLEGIRKKYSQQDFIFHLKIYHLTKDRRFKINPKKFVTKLYNEGWKIIHITRRNHMNHVFSNFIAEQRGNFEKHDNRNEKIQFSLDLDLFKRRMSNRIEYLKKERLILDQIDFFEVVYEKDLEKPEYHRETISNILEYLGLENENIKVESDYKKVNTYNYSEILQNHDEFIDFLKKNNWYHFIENETV